MLGTTSTTTKPSPFAINVVVVVRYYLRTVAFLYYLPAYVFMLFSIDYLLAQVRNIRHR